MAENRSSEPIRQWLLLGGKHTQPKDPTVLDGSGPQATFDWRNIPAKGKEPAQPNIVPSPHDLAAIFGANKFQLLEEGDKRMATTGIAPTPQPKEDKGKEGKEGKEETYVLGNNVSDEFQPQADKAGVVVLQDGKVYNVVKKDNPEQPLNKEGPITNHKSVKAFLTALCNE